ncbi:xanthine dehydrogenase family protein subunit M [Falsiroseomonas sp.]|uniref:FAD binding domain-containing protein n=1 Tax=Falsiroseomonas sp. TaxID=2870721 RepID=UPI002715B01E|nr:xanthine dehydrogenase family protein subunit M [Falsiroseomonas sp.]MDO9498667.1 xanthine dehydrogenase family protein subunit M [Falsiroseomonas sp.]
MKPAPFAWHAPEELEAALALKAEHGGEARFLAGGQSLVPAMNFRVAQPAVLVDLNRIATLDTLGFTADGTLVIGAMCRYRRIERDADVARRLPMLAEALAEVAHPQIRTRGTLAGNLCHADPASEMPAVMLALAARFLLRRKGGERLIAARDFFLGPLATALAEDEMLAEIHIPALPPGSGTAFLEVARRRGDYAMMGVAAVLRRGADGRCAAARLTLCSAGPVPLAADRAASSLLGTRLAAGDFAEAAALVGAEIDPMGSVQASPAYQRHLAGVLVTRALSLAAERAA